MFVFYIVISKEMSYTYDPYIINYNNNINFMRTLYLLLFGLSIVLHAIVIRFLRLRPPVYLENLSRGRIIIYLFLAIIFTIILLTFYYNLIRVYILKRPLNQNSVFNIKKQLEELRENYGPTTALKTLFLFIQNRILPSLHRLGLLPFSLENYDNTFQRLMGFFCNHPRVFGRYSYHILHLIFIGLPKILVANMFLIDICYYEHLNLFFKFSLLLVIPLMFNSIFGILKIFHDENIDRFTNLLRSDFRDIKIVYTYLLLQAFKKVYINFEKVKHQFNFITIYVLHAYLMGFIYILYFFYLKEYI